MANYSIKKKNSFGINAFNILREFFGMFFLFLFICSALSLYSYVPTDPTLFVATNASTQNLIGKLGSNISSLLLQIFGFGSFLISLLFVFMSAACFRKISRSEWLVASINYALLIMSICACLALTKAHSFYNGGKVLFGGVLGLELSSFFQQYLNLGGAIVLSGFLFLFAISLSTKIKLSDMAIYFWWGLSKSFLLLSAYLLILAANIVALSRHLLEFIFGCSIQFWKACTGALTTMKKLKPSAKNYAIVKGKTLDALDFLNPNTKEEHLPHIPEEQKATEIKDTSEKVLPAEPSDASDDLKIIENATMNTELGLVSGNSLIKKSDRNLADSLKASAKKNDINLRKKLSGPIIDYKLPPTSFLKKAPPESRKINRSELYANSALLEEKLADFKVLGKVKAVKPGPVVTMYEFKPGPGIKVNSITNLADDLALALSAPSVRIEAPIPGRDVVGIEVPNKEREAVYLQEIIDSSEFHNQKYNIPIAIGKNILGEPIVADFRKMPHLLVSGATGSGKSVFINAVISSLLYRFTPNELKMILVDPKQLELNFYENIPHLLLPVVTEPKKASLALKWAVNEMESRYKLISKSGMRDIDSFNQKLESIGKEKMAKLLNVEEDEYEMPIPKIMIVIDELADLMMTCKADVESNICRLAQKARAAGIHLMLATQRPSVDVVTGLIKANLPTRISFRLSSKMDSRTIFDTMGAERLVGMGDMLFMPPGESRLLRMHGAYVDEAELNQIADFWREQGNPEYRDEILVDEEEEGSSNNFADEEQDKLFTDAVDIALSTGYISSSMLQRRLRVGYNRAARMVEMMETKGIVGPADGSKPRPVLSQAT